jgi:hypothetical protein
MRLSIFIVLLFTLNGCGNANTADVMLEKILQENKNHPHYAAVQQMANRSIQQWIDEGITETKVLKECPWKLDQAVLFNATRDRAYLLLLIQDNLPLAELDYVYVLYAALEEDKWNLYFEGLPNLVFPRPKNSNHPISFSELSAMARTEFSKSYLNSEGKINDPFINRTYTADLKARHLKFLNQK